MENPWSARRTAKYTYTYILYIYRYRYRYILDQLLICPFFSSSELPSPGSVYKSLEAVCGRQRPAYVCMYVCMYVCCWTGPPQYNNVNLVMLKSTTPAEKQSRHFSLFSFSSMDSWDLVIPLFMYVQYWYLGCGWWLPETTDHRSWQISLLHRGRGSCCTSCHTRWSILLLSEGF